MENNFNTGAQKDPELWAIAKKRAGFKYNLASYIVMNIFFWALWYITGADTYGNNIPWPVWPMFGWGIGLFFHFSGAYLYPKHNTAEREYEKLVDQHSK